MIEIEEKTDLINIACDRFHKVQRTRVEKFNKLDEWLDKESSMFEKETITPSKTYHKFKRGQIIKADFGINIGSELSYTHFAIVLNNNDNIFNKTLLVVPITSKKGTNRVDLGKILLKAYPNTKKFNLECYANISQIKNISKDRILQDKKQYVCRSDILNKIDDLLIKMYTKCENKQK